MKGFAGMTKAPFLTRTNRESKAASIKKPSKTPKTLSREPASVGGKNFYSDDEMRQRND